MRLRITQSKRVASITSICVSQTWKRRKSFTGNFCHSLDSFTKSPVDTSIPFIPLTPANRRNSLALVQIRTTNRIAHALRFGLTRGKKWIGLQSSCEKPAGKSSRVRKFAKATVPATTRSFSKTSMATNWKFAAARSRSSRVEVATKGKSRARHSGACRLRTSSQRRLEQTCSANLRLAESEGMANTHEIDDPSGTSEPPHCRGRLPRSLSQADRAFQNG